MGQRIKENWACSIIAQALMEIKTKKDIPRVVEKVKGTAVGGRPDILREFLKLVKAKEKLVVS